MSDRLIEALRREYVTGRIEIDEFEQRLDRILHGNPMPVDALRPLDRDDLIYGPGVVIPVRSDNSADLIFG